MAWIISAIDERTKTVTIDHVAEGDCPCVPCNPRVEYVIDGVKMKLGMEVVGDGIDENGMFINPRRVK